MLRAMSNRRVGGGVGISALQTGGMGEGWSDFYAMTLLSEAGDNVNGCYASGGYASYLLSGLTHYWTFYNETRLHQSLGYRPPALVYNTR